MTQCDAGALRQIRPWIVLAAVACLAAPGADADRSNEACATSEGSAAVSFQRIRSAQLRVPLPKVRDRESLPDSHLPWMPEVMPPAREDFPAVYNYTGGEDDVEVAGLKLDALLASALPVYGAVVVKGLPLATPASFSRLVHATNMTLVDYIGGVTSRQQLAPKVTPASMEAAFVSMEPHMDNPYWPQPPARLILFVNTPPQSGGQAMLSDTRQVLRRLRESSPEVLAELERREVRYEHFYPDKDAGGTVITSWQDSLAKGCVAADGCNATKVAEDGMIERGYGFEWVANGLKRWEVVPPVLRHPTTGEETWANMLTAMHCTVFDNHPEYPEFNRPPEERDKPCEMRGQMPYHTSYGDGTPVPVSSMHAFRKAQWDSAVSFDYEAGDLLAIDNYYAMHGRFSFEPPRELYLVMVGQ